MEVKGTFRVLGAKGFKGEVEGTNYNSTTLYVEMDVSERNGTEVGKDATRMKFGTEDEFQKIKHLPFPLEAELTLELTTKGPEVRGFRVLQPAPASTPPASPVK